MLVAHQSACQRSSAIASVSFTSWTVWSMFQLDPHFLLFPLYLENKSYQHGDYSLMQFLDPFSLGPKFK